MLCLTALAVDMSAFVTLDHFLQHTVLSVGIRNVAAMFHHMMPLILGDVPYCNVYLVMVIHSETCVDHITLTKVFL